MPSVPKPQALDETKLRQRLEYLTELAQSLVKLIDELAWDVLKQGVRPRKKTYKHPNEIPF